MENDDVASMELPPGFRFHPTDEEIIMHYLLKKVLDRGFKATAISDADLNKCEPWDLPKKGKMGEKEWFFFFQRDKKYPTGARTNRATESGYWKATGKDREIHYKSKSCLVGMKKTLVFYRGRAPKGEKTDWVMHEYRLEGKFSNYNLSRSAKEEFVVCRVFHKNTGNRTPSTLAGFELARIDSLVDHLSDSSTLPPLMDYYTSCSNSFATREHDQWQGSNIGSSSRVFLNNHKLQYLQYYMPIQEGFGPGMSSYQHNVFPFKGGYGEENLRVMTPKMEQYFSSKNLGISQSEETGHSMENVGNYESTTWQSKGDDVESRNIVKPFDYQEIEGLGFSPGISDLDSLWSY